MKIGIFGGSFNPFHRGHLNSLKTVKEKAALDKVIVVPTNQNPLKEKKPSDPTPQQRLAMVKLALIDYEDEFEVDAREIERGGLSYSIDTVKSFLQENFEDQFYFIVGLDEFHRLPQWKSYKELLKITNFVVTSRPGSRIPIRQSEFPEEIDKLTTQFEGFVALLKTGKTIEFVQLHDVEASATSIRAKVNLGKNVGGQLDLRVEHYILQNGLYKTEGPDKIDYLQMTQFILKQLNDREAIRPLAFNLSKISSATEYALVASGTSRKQTASFAQRILDEVKQEFGLSPIATEGLSEGGWVLLDYGALMVHLFYDYIRQEYNLEELWREGQPIEMAAQTK